MFFAFQLLFPGSPNNIDYYSIYHEFIITPILYSRDYYYLLRNNSYNDYYIPYRLNEKNNGSRDIIMTVKMEKVKDFRLNKDGNLEWFICGGCNKGYRNPLLQNNYRNFDSGCEVRMSKDGIDINCKKCGITLIEITP